MLRGIKKWNVSIFKISQTGQLMKINWGQSIKPIILFVSNRKSIRLFTQQNQIQTIRGIPNSTKTSKK